MRLYIYKAVLQELNVENMLIIWFQESISSNMYRVLALEQLFETYDVWTCYSKP